MARTRVSSWRLRARRLCARSALVGECPASAALPLTASSASRLRVAGPSAAALSKNGRGSAGGAAGSGGRHEQGRRRGGPGRHAAPPRHPGDRVPARGHGLYQYVCSACLPVKRPSCVHSCGSRAAWTHSWCDDCALGNTAAAPVHWPSLQQRGRRFGRVDVLRDRPRCTCQSMASRPDSLAEGELLPTRALPPHAPMPPHAPCLARSCCRAATLSIRSSRPRCASGSSTTLVRRPGAGQGGG